ncbi:hypothetical protein DFJ63DRAFT_334395 [Scheffersomyces coipomensis]|uniref:uncharacterized protein n=1 Tax=Scheffersomyces coipomensis TaxID=1788519 RepID=UPI00315CF762
MYIPQDEIVQLSKRDGLSLGGFLLIILLIAAVVIGVCVGASTSKANPQHSTSTINTANDANTINTSNSTNSTNNTIASNSTLITDTSNTTTTTTITNVSGTSKSIMTITKTSEPNSTQFIPVAPNLPLPVHKKEK